uniref:Uncharacterized protein n=1 Tax=Peronospora matthiolae TaxID=2874970 RepID=A0AAV1UFF9_9STRA
MAAFTETPLEERGAGHLVPGLLSGVSTSTDTSGNSIFRIASLVVMYRSNITISTRPIVEWTCVGEDLSDESLGPKISDMMPPRSPEPVSLALAESAPNDPEA